MARKALTPAPAPAPAAQGTPAPAPAGKAQGKAARKALKAARKALKAQGTPAPAAALTLAQATALPATHPATGGTAQQATPAPAGKGKGKGKGKRTPTPPAPTPAAAALDALEASALALRPHRATPRYQGKGTGGAALTHHTITGGLKGPSPAYLDRLTAGKAQQGMGAAALKGYRKAMIQRHATLAMHEAAGTLKAGNLKGTLALLPAGFTLLP